MNTWLYQGDQRHTDRARRLVEILLAPRAPADSALTLEAHFKGMTAEPTEVGVLPDTLMHVAA
ncbi:hypothetical protein [Methyloversatilis sp. XJ19-49]|uniref:hypothetical protein n=1 Tax=Methyloversatilis sp. XJ19-49 TaxID=2963429 RepID=UPI00211CBABD|nr:hypothetical protein [Methyloversatilis sp. XJ19-49]MCQ9376947.1 hypothetical protein [Methyloversatilis sp. XJ19-49]